MVYMQCTLGLYIALSPQKQQLLRWSSLLHKYFPYQYCSEDVIQAIQDRNGMDMLTALVNSGANINLPAPDGSYPIHVAVATKRHETVLFLLNKAASLKERRNVCTH